MTDPAPTYDPEPMLRTLRKHDVRFVVIGGFAANYHGSPHLTFDLDITPERSDENLARLWSALTELGAKVRARGVEPLPFRHDARSLGAVDVWNLITPFGDLDISFVPAGTSGYADLHRDALQADALGVRVELASLADVVRSKEAADRPKDHVTLPTLRRILDEQT